MAEEKKDKAASEVYDELSGFFPAEYDLTPEELESFEENNGENYYEEEIIEEPFENIDNALYDEATSEISEDVIEEKNEEQEISNSENKKKTNVLAEIYDIIEMFSICTACIIILISIFMRVTVVDGDSMNNTLENGELLMITDFMYKPTRGDIVVLQNTSLTNQELKKPLIKRIIATGGETVEISPAGVVTIIDKDGNSQILSEEYAYLEGGFYSSAFPDGSYEVPEGCIFVMGDNRNGSTDSRFSDVGFVDERCIIGKAFLRMLPADKFGTITNPFEKE